MDTRKYWSVQFESLVRSERFQLSPSSSVRPSRVPVCLQLLLSSLSVQFQSLICSDLCSQIFLLSLFWEFFFIIDSIFCILAKSAL